MSKSRRRKTQKPGAPAATVPDFDAFARQAMVDAEEVTAEERSASGSGFQNSMNPSHVLALEVVRAALPKTLRAAVMGLDAVVALVEVPGEAWIKPISSALSDLFRGRADILATPRRTIRTNEEHPTRIVTGPLIVVASDLQIVASELIAGADFVLRLGLSPDAVGRAMTLLYGRAPKIEAADLAGLGWRNVVMALRANSTGAQSLKRLRASNAKLRAGAGVNVTPSLTDLHGFGAAMQTLRAVAVDIVATRNDPAARDTVLPSLLFYGPPGTGKSTLARALSRSVDLPLLSVSVGDWFAGNNAHLGTVVGEARRFFEQAIACAPCVALIDELDAIPDRARLDDRAREWWTPLVTTVLVGIDRMRTRDSRIVLVGATNHLDKLDPALIRPGRFDRHLQIIGPQTVADVIGVLRFHLKGDLAAEILEPIAEIALAHEMTAAALEGAVRAARDLARTCDRSLSLADLVDQIAPPETRDAASVRRTAIHEAGHAILAVAVGLKITRVSIVAKERSLGMTTYSDQVGIPMSGRAAIESHVVATLAGRAADEVLSDGPTAGAVSDLRLATRLITSIHCCFGLGSTLVSRGDYDQAESLLTYDPLLTRLVGEELDRLMERARDLVRRHGPAIRALADLLVERRIATEADVVAAYEQGMMDRSMNESRDRRRPVRAPRKPA